MKVIYTGLIMVILCMGMVFNSERLNGTLNSSEEIAKDPSIERLRHFALQDAAPVSEEQYGYTATPDHQPLEIIPSGTSGLRYMAYTPYYKVFFEGTTIKMVIGDYWIECELTEVIESGECADCARNEKLVNTKLESHNEQNLLSVAEVFPSVDLSYKVDTSVLMESLLLKTPLQWERVILNISWEGITPVYEGG